MDISIEDQRWEFVCDKRSSEEQLVSYWVSLLTSGYVDTSDKWLHLWGELSESFKSRSIEWKIVPRNDNFMLMYWIFPIEDQSFRYYKIYCQSVFFRFKN